MKLKLKIVILAGIILTIAVAVYLYPAETSYAYCVVLVFVGIGTLIWGMKYPKWYVRLYTAIWAIWEILFFFYMLGSPFWGIAFGQLLSIGLTLPSIPLWYLWYKVGLPSMIREVKKIFEE